MNGWTGIANDLTEDAVVGWAYEGQTPAPQAGDTASTHPSIKKTKKRHPFISFLRVIFSVALGISLFFLFFLLFLIIRRLI